MMPIPISALRLEHHFREPHPIADPNGNDLVIEVTFGIVAPGRVAIAEIDHGARPRLGCMVAAWLGWKVQVGRDVQNLI